MKNMFPLRVKAHKLLVDDHFKVAGRMYRIRMVRESIIADHMVLLAYPIYGEVSDTLSMSVHRRTKFKIYNQK